MLTTVAGTWHVAPLGWHVPRGTATSGRAITPSTSQRLRRLASSTPNARTETWISDRTGHTWSVACSRGRAVIAAP
ncbi:hypothetical protein BE15_29400 [Sorangium cellulosum]|uniref:Uncharacterized protein n=1 Tax=Sorangium cellulosum TaxID=56 RepID=A0A150QJ45_SORCE|nr:hypothetical protein BE15_29400 [Sorangium cellulosum]